MLETRKHATTELNDLVGEASRALARLDAERLEELARSCDALSRNLPALPGGDASRAAASPETRRRMAVFGRVLAVTRGNLEVMRQLRAFESGLLEYSAPAGLGWTARETRDGDN